MKTRPSQVPAEHGSWAFLLLPVGAALALAPSRAGAWLALAGLVAFLARVPVKRAFRARRVLAGDRALLLLEVLAATGAIGLALPRLPLAALVLLAAALGPASLAVAADFRGRGRGLGTEMLSILAPCLLGAAVLAAGAAPLRQAALLAAGSFLSLAAPVIYLRGVLDRQKGRAGGSPVPSLLAHGVAFAAAFALHALGGVGWLWPAWMGALALRAAAEPLLFRQLPDARVLGFREVAVCGLSAVVLVLSMASGTPFGP